MRKGRYNKSERLAIVAKQDARQSAESISREYQISPATFYNWKKALADEQNEDWRRLKHLGQENARLKKMYAELSVYHEMLSEGYQMLKL